jgi:ABC-type uncharacterized transport system permease subunit
MVAMADVVAVVVFTTVGLMVGQLHNRPKVKQLLARLLLNTETLGQLVLLAVAGVEQVAAQEELV